jgi:hypothetical protein
MAKKPLPPKRAPGGKGPGPGAPSPAQSEAVGKFDKFAAFALVIPCTLLSIVALVLAIGYTSDQHDVGLFGFPGKTIVNWNQGTDSVQKLTGSAQITGFEQTGYIGRIAEGEMDVARINVGANHNVNMGDVFVLAGGTSEDVRLEFVVFDLQPDTCRAYILLGQDVSGDKERKFSLRADELKTLCGGDSNIELSRPWTDQIVRRYVEERSNKQ